MELSPQWYGNSKRNETYQVILLLPLRVIKKAPAVTAGAF
jgi:hypothetical protein